MSSFTLLYSETGAKEAAGAIGHQDAPYYSSAIRGNVWKLNEWEALYRKQQFGSKGRRPRKHVLP